MVLFARRDIDQYTNSLADYLPGGCLFASASVSNSNFRKLLRGMAGELFRANGLLKEYSEEIIPDQTVKFIGEWEQALGIPDDCFSGTGSITERRRDVLVKLASLGVQTAQDFIDLGTIFGAAVTVQAGRDTITFPLTFPVFMFSTLKEARFTIVFTVESEIFPYTFPLTFPAKAAETFPLTFPITFGVSEQSILECLFTALKPANCKVIFT